MTSNSNHTSPRNSLRRSPTLQSIPRESLISYLRRNFFSNVQDSVQLENPQDEGEDDPNINNNIPYNYFSSLNNPNNPENQNDQENEGGNDEGNEEGNSLEENQDYQNISYHSLDENYTLNYPQEDYIDFRLYPLDIDWKEVESSDNNYYEIYDVYGCFGIATFSLLGNVTHLTLKYNDYIYSVLNFFLNSFSNKDYNNIKSLYEHLPKLKKINIILSKGMISKKEIVIMKIVLDLYEQYIFELNNDLIFNDNEDKMKEYIYTAKIFYTQTLNDEDIKFIHEIITHEMKRTYEILKKMKIKIYKNKVGYIKHLIELKHSYFSLKHGLNKKLFVM